MKNVNGPASSSGKALGYGLDDPGSIPGVGGVEIFLHSFVPKNGMYMYISGFRARQHLRSLAPVMNDDG